MNLRNIKSVKQRREQVEKDLQLKLPNIGYFSMDEQTTSSRNCENMIGVTQIPLGIAGPLRIRSEEVRSVIPDPIGNLKKKKDSHFRGNDNKSNYYIPLATTEGALVASVNRGCKAITDSGGLDVGVEKIGVTRGPVFKINNLQEGRKFINFIEHNFEKLKKQAESTSHHLKLIKFDQTIVGKYVFIRFYFDTQDAMGLNMITIATEAIADYLYQKTKVKCLSLSGNYCTDKKASWQNFINKRGFAVRAEIVLSPEVIKSVLKTSAQKIYDVWLAKCILGSIASGSLGFNCHFANVLSALFIATGQDPAHVVEGAMGITTVEVVSRRSSVIGHQTINSYHQKTEDRRQKTNSLYISIYSPSVMIGTIGGGTGLATQKEALQILGLSGGNEGKNAIRFAEIVGGVVLAGEISLLASLAEGSLANAHQKFRKTLNSKNITSV